MPVLCKGGGTGVAKPSHPYPLGMGSLNLEAQPPAIQEQEEGAWERTGRHIRPSFPRKSRLHRKLWFPALNTELHSPIS